MFIFTDTKFKLKERVKIVKGRLRGKKGIVKSIMFSTSQHLKRGKGTKYFLQIEGLKGNKKKLDFFKENSLEVYEEIK